MRLVKTRYGILTAVWQQSGASLLEVGSRSDVTGVRPQNGENAKLHCRGSRILISRNPPSALVGYGANAFHERQSFHIATSLPSSTATTQHTLIDLGKPS